jgi:hypothetical protein
VSRPLAGVGVQRLPGAEADPLLGQRWHQLLGQQPGRGRRLLAGDLPDGGQLIARAEAVGVGFHQRHLQLLVQAGDADHEELVQVPGVDGQELHPLQQRPAGAQRLVQHAIVEGQPRDLAVDEQRGVVQVGRGDGDGGGAGVGGAG